MKGELASRTSLKPFFQLTKFSTGTDYQVLVRKQLQVFEAAAEDVEFCAQGRKKQVVLGQVGLRCKHCAIIPLNARGRGAVYYPTKLQSVYQAAQNMSMSHLCEACEHIPSQTKSDLRQLREKRGNAIGGKQYWSASCRVLGIFETEHGLRLRTGPSGNTGFK